EKDHVYRACFLMMSGLVKKILIADPIAGRIAPVFANPDEYSSMSLFLAGITYSLQVYSDFSGLTDMARSVALFLGFEIPENFAAPFFALSGRELWQKWHMTLSFWLRDYIYFPLGGNRKGEFRTYINLIITMTLGGFWHGADYTFVAWGAFWGCILVSERFLEDKLGLPLVPQKNVVLKIGKAVIVFILFSISALMFRSNSATLMVDLFRGLFVNSGNYLQQIFINSDGGWLLNGMYLISGEPSFRMNSLKNLESFIYMFVMVVFFHYLQFRPADLDKFSKYRFPVVVAAGVITIFLITTLSQDGDAFIYYKF
ncbi:MAG: MBOAT family protein, partial [Leptospira sp.]|nr:MBOAT family protein [Leptospira sp.]